jgi:hypothetical protein
LRGLKPPPPSDARFSAGCKIVPIYEAFRGGGEAAENVAQGLKAVPQRLKPDSFCGPCGTNEFVPCYKARWFCVFQQDLSGLAPSLRDWCGFWGHYPGPRFACPGLFSFHPSGMRGAESAGFIHHGRAGTVDDYRETKDKLRDPTHRTRVSRSGSFDFAALRSG